MAPALPASADGIDGPSAMPGSVNGQSNAGGPVGLQAWRQGQQQQEQTASMGQQGLSSPNLSPMGSPAPSRPASIRPSSQNGEPFSDTGQRPLLALRQGSNQKLGYGSSNSQRRNSSPLLGPPNFTGPGGLAGCIPVLWPLLQSDCRRQLRLCSKQLRTAGDACVTSLNWVPSLPAAKGESVVEGMAQASVHSPRHVASVKAQPEPGHEEQAQLGRQLAAAAGRWPSTSHLTLDFSAGTLSPSSGPAGAGACPLPLPASHLLSAAFPQLQLLTIRGAGSYDVSIVLLTVSASQLLQLVLDGCSGLSDLDVRVLQVLQDCSHLQQLTIRHTRESTAGLRERLGGLGLGHVLVKEKMPKLQQASQSEGLQQAGPEQTGQVAQQDAEQLLLMLQADESQHLGTQHLEDAVTLAHLAQVSQASSSGSQQFASSPQQQQQQQRHGEEVDLQQQQQRQQQQQHHRWQGEQAGLQAQEQQRQGNEVDLQQQLGGEDVHQQRHAAQTSAPLPRIQIRGERPRKSVTLNLGSTGRCSPPSATSDASPGNSRPPSQRLSAPQLMLASSTASQAAPQLWRLPPFPLPDDWQPAPPVVSQPDSTSHSMHSQQQQAQGRDGLSSRDSVRTPGTSGCPSTGKSSSPRKHSSKPCSKPSSKPPSRHSSGNGARCTQVDDLSGLLTAALQPLNDFMDATQGMPPGMPFTPSGKKLQPRDSTEDLETLLLLPAKGAGSIRQQLQNLQHLQQSQTGATAEQHGLQGAAAEQQGSPSSSSKGRSFKFAPLVPPTVPQAPASASQPYGGLQRGIWDAQATVPTASGADSGGVSCQTGVGAEAGPGLTLLAPVPEDQEFGNMINSQTSQGMSILLESSMSTASDLHGDQANASLAQGQTSGTLSRPGSILALGNMSTAGTSMGTAMRNLWASSQVKEMRQRNAAFNPDNAQDLEDSIIANRRTLDERCALLQEISIDKILGFGSMGMVYFARMWDHRVVVKLIEHGNGLLGKEQHRGRLARIEAVVSRLMIHPNIVITYDCCTGPLDKQSLIGKPGGGAPRGSSTGKAGKPRNMTVIVQEYCEGGTLRDALNKRRFGLDPSAPEYATRVTKLALDIANGMKYLATLRILHIDLKAENVLLQKAPEGANTYGTGVVAKVADFGLAQVLPPDVDELKSGIHGTVSHMPPEAMKDTVFSLATDVYSFGVMLWEMVTQEHPFKGLAAHQVVDNVVQGGKRPPWGNHKVSPALQQLTESCWATEPSARPSFVEVVQRLRELVADPTGASLTEAQNSTGGRRAGDRGSSYAGSTLSDESDELEAALRQQRRQQHHGAAAAGAGAMAAAAQRSPRLSLVSGSEGGDGPRRFADDGPPKDQLGRMLYHLSRVPQFQAVKQVAEEATGSQRWVCYVEMAVQPIVIGE